MKLPKLSTITQSFKKILKYLFIILLAINIAIYISIFLFQEKTDNIYKRHELALGGVMAFYVILYDIIIPGIVETISFVYNKRIMGRNANRHYEIS